MHKQQFKTYLALYGADLQRWPQPDRQKAEAALRESQELRELLAAELRFEHVLRSRAEIDAPADLATRIIAQAQPRTSNGRSWKDLAAALWAPKSLAAAAAVFVVGLMIGWYQPLNGQRVQQISENTELQLNNFLNYEEVNLWPEN